MSDETVRMQRVRRNKGFESISRDSLQNQTLSFKARGIMAYLESMPDDWEVHGAKGIAAASDKDGYSAVNEGLKELEAAGLLARLKRQGAGAHWEWLWIYSDSAIEVAEAVCEWPEVGIVSSRGGNPHPVRPDPAADSVLQFSVHGGSVDGQPVHGKLPNKEVNSEVYSRSFARDKSLASGEPPSEDLFSVGETGDQDPEINSSSREQDQGRYGGDQHLATVKESSMVTAQDVTAKWVDTYREVLGEKPTKQRIGQVSREAKQLLDAGRDPRKVMYAAKTAASGGYPTIVREYDRLVLQHQGRQQGVDPRPSTTDQRVAQGLRLAAKYEALDRAEDQRSQPDAIYAPSTRI